MNDIQIFNNSIFGSVRMIEINNKPYAVANDVAKALGYSNPRDAISKHCKGVVKCDTLTNGGVQKVSSIPEGDIYRLIIRSKLPQAEKFESWVTDEILPKIRRTGGFIPTSADMSDQEIMARALTIAQNTIANKDKLLEEAKPKIVFADSVAASNGTILIRELSKILNKNGFDIGQQRLFAWLRDSGYLIKRKGRDYNTPTQKSMDLGVMDIKETAISRTEGTVLSTTTLITGKGQVYFVNKFKNAKGG